MKGRINISSVVFRAVLFGLSAFSVVGIDGCSVQRTRIRTITEKKVAATLALSRNELEEERKVIHVSKRDTIKVTGENGQELILMKAIKDDATGDMVVNEVIDAAVITARFRNIAERHGKIDLKFEIIVPQQMQDTKWQLRFYPDMFILEDSLRLESVYITGEDYRKGQLRGYEQYERFLRSIVTDTTKFVDLRNLEIFLKRNIPEVYYFKNDTSFVSDEQFASVYGVTERDAVEHYTNWISYRINEKKKDRRRLMYAKYVRSPIVSEGVRLDTVLRSLNGDFVYQYTQTISTRPRLRKVDVILSGDIYESDQRLYSMPRTEPLTFYISSMSTLVDNTERYMTKVYERRASANTACYVDFKQGRYDVLPELGSNAEELGRIRSNIVDVMQNKTFDLDSIVIAASASPEGALSLNNALSSKRAASVADYFRKDIRHFQDSVRNANSTFTVHVDESGKEKVVMNKIDVPEITFVSRSNGENWDMLALLVDKDTVLTEADKRSFLKLFEIRDVDSREHTLQKESKYRYIRETLYPKLRTVRFDFYLHRKGMVKDTIHTTELDTVYMKGVQLLKDRDYKAALEYLKDYRDYNTAIAYVSMDYNASAMAILQEIERTPAVNYMLAVLYARNDDDQNAVQCYLDACKEDRSFVFRGNLDPEIYVLIQRYGLNKQDDDDLSDMY